MKIAVTYENGNVFQHFGHTEAFKLYDVEDGKIVSSQVISGNGVGHEALAGLLEDHDVNVLICGGIGAGAQAALEASGIELCSGASGSADAAVEAYLKGELVSAGVNCCRHHEGEHSCGKEHNGSSGKNVGKTVRAHYRGTFNDGTQFDSSYDRGEPIEFVCGAGMMIPGFDKAVADMEVGQTVQVHLMPEEAYGQPDPRAIVKIPLNMLPGAEHLQAGQRVLLSTASGQPFPASVVAVDETTATFDANHEMAGKELNFQIELVEVK